MHAGFLLPVKQKTFLLRFVLVMYRMLDEPNVRCCGLLSFLVIIFIGERDARAFGVRHSVVSSRMGRMWSMCIDELFFFN